MSMLERMRRLLRPGKDNDEMSDTAFMGSPAATGMGHHHATKDAIPADDLGAEGGPPSHDDPLKAQVP